MTKQEIIQQLEEQVKAEPFESNRTQFTDWTSKFNLLKEESTKVQMAESLAEGESENEFE